MNTDRDAFTALPYPRTRLLMVDGGRLGLKKHTVHGLVEFDITRARDAICATTRPKRVKPSPSRRFSWRAWAKRWI